jgi:hypothetical protein
VDSECILDQKAALDRYDPFRTPFIYDAHSTSTNKLGFKGGVIQTPTYLTRAESYDARPCTLRACPDCTDMYDDYGFAVAERNQYMDQGQTVLQVTAAKEEVSRERLERSGRSDLRLRIETPSVVCLQSPER